MFHSRSLSLVLICEERLTVVETDKICLEKQMIVFSRGTETDRSGLNQRKAEQQYTGFCYRYVRYFYEYV